METRTGGKVLVKHFSKPTGSGGTGAGLFTKKTEETPGFDSSK